MTYGKCILLGKERVYMVLNERGGSKMKRMQPYVGIRGKGSGAILGVGFHILIDNESNMFWGVLHEQYQIIQVWRAAQLLERVDCVDDQGKALVASLSLFGSRQASCSLDAEYVRELAHHFNGMHHLMEAVEEISATLPDVDDLDILIGNVRSEHIFIDISELMCEMRRHGRTINTAVIQSLMEEYEAYRAEQAKPFWKQVIDACTPHT